MQRRCAHGAGAGFTLVEMLVVVLIIGVISAGVLLSVSLTGRDRELEKESDRLLALFTYAREQAELQTREYGVLFQDDGYEFLTYDMRRASWRSVFEDEALGARKLPDGLGVKLTVVNQPLSSPALRSAGRTLMSIRSTPGTSVATTCWRQCQLRPAKSLSPSELPMEGCWPDRRRLAI